MILTQIAIDKEFQALIPPLGKDELLELEGSLLADGCRDPLVVWDGVLLDGHHRHTICERYGLPFAVFERTCGDRDEAKAWIIRNQFARRNLTPFQRAELALKLKPLLAGRAKERQGTRTDLEPTYGKYCPEVRRARDELGAQAGVSGRTVEKVEALLEKADEGTLASLRNGDVSISSAYNSLRGAHVMHNTGESEWYTPKAIIEAARVAMGGIDLDPASHADAQAVVGAGSYFSSADDGLVQAWWGRVWMNPPYAQPLIGQFSEKLVAELDAGRVDAAITLTNNATETEWGQLLMSRADVVCFPRGRVKFWAPGKESSVPLQGQMLCAFNVPSFKTHFARLGHVR